MMSHDLGAVDTQRTGDFPLKSPSGTRLGFLGLAGALLLCSGLVAARADAQQMGPQLSQAHPAPVARTAAVAPATSAATPAPDVPASPIVTYVGGQLTIYAENATLSQILNLLHSTMGTEVDVPAGSASERVWVHIGPGSAHKVLSDLFANTDLDYILQSSASDPNAIHTLTLSVRSQEGPKNAPAGVESASEGRGSRYVRNPVVSAPAAEPEPVHASEEASAVAASVAPAATAPAAQPPATDSSAAAGSTPASADAPMATPVQSSMEPTGPSNVYPQTPQPSASGFNPHPTPPPNMSSDQMVQQLSNMYQQRRQMQNGQASSTPN